MRSPPHAPHRRDGRGHHQNSESQVQRFELAGGHCHILVGQGTPVKLLCMYLGLAVLIRELWRKLGDDEVRKAAYRGG